MQTIQTSRQDTSHKHGSLWGARATQLVKNIWPAIEYELIRDGKPFSKAIISSMIDLENLYRISTDAAVPSEFRLQVMEHINSLRGISANPNILEVADIPDSAFQHHEQLQIMVVNAITYLPAGAITQEDLIRKLGVNYE